MTDMADPKIDLLLLRTETLDKKVHKLERTVQSLELFAGALIVALFIVAVAWLDSKTGGNSTPYCETRCD